MFVIFSPWRTVMEKSWLEDWFMYRFTHVFCRVNHGEDLFVCLCVWVELRVLHHALFISTVLQQRQLADSTVRKAICIQNCNKVHIHHCKKDNMHTVNLISLYPEYFTVLVPPSTDAWCMMFCKHACYTTKHFFHLSFHHPSRVFCFVRTVK